MGLQEKQQAVEGAAQAALEASSAAEAQHAAGAKQLAADKRSLQEQQDHGRTFSCPNTAVSACLSDYATLNSTNITYAVSHMQFSC